MKKWLFIIFLSTTIVHSQERSFTIRLDDEKIKDNKLYFDSLTLLVLPVTQTLNQLSKKIGATIIDLKDIESSELRLESLKYDAKISNVGTLLIYQNRNYTGEKIDTFNIKEVRQMNEDFRKYARFIEGFDFNRLYPPDFIETFELDTNNNQRRIIDSVSYSSFSDNDAVYIVFSRSKENSFFIIHEDDVRLNPFLLKNTPVTNGEYKEFVRWVQDSIVREILWSYVDELDYEDYELDNALKREMIVIRKEFSNIPLDSLNRNMFNFNKKFEFSYTDRWVVPNLDKYLYLPSAQRYYRAPKVDTRKLKYKYHNRSMNVDIFPDTLGFVRTNPNNDQSDRLTNMYFWHPAYDNHPVVNISHKQMMAYLHWKEMMLNQEFAKKEFKVTLELPKMEEKELAMIQMKKGNLHHKFTLSQPFIKQCDSAKLLSKVEWSPISRVDIESRKIQFLGWNISEYSQTHPGRLSAEMNDMKWSAKAKIIYGTNWIDRTKTYQDGFCTDAQETTDVVEDTNFSRPYLGFRYTIRIIEE